MSKPAWLVVLAACGPTGHGEPPAAPAADRHAMQHHFESAEACAKSFDDPARDRWQQPQLVLDALELGPGMVIADIGAGTGYFSVRLARAVPDGQVIATDIEPDMIRYLTERATREHLTNLRAVQTPPADPQLAAGTVDRILVVDVWHHIDDRAGYARALARALRPGGKLAIVDFTREATHGPPVEMRLTPEQVIGELRQAGLAAALSPIVLPDQYIVIGTR
jgi:cyclopropane fatty-acyl-phospholipid synthase-like methyltransferase